MRHMLKDETGQVLPLVLAAMTIGILVVVPFVQYASTEVRGTRVYQDKMTQQYSADAGVEHAIWRLAYEDGFASSLTPDNPSTQYTVTLNDSDVLVTVTTMDTQGAGGGSDDLTVNKVVSPTTADPGVETTFTYIITITNNKVITEYIKQILDEMPSSFSYVTGSSKGVTTDDPNVQGQTLTWGFNPRIPINPGESKHQVFQATATLNSGTYYNYVRVQCGLIGPPEIITYRGAPVGVGGGGDENYITKDVNPAAAGVGVETSFTYTIYIHNDDLEVLEITQVGDDLALGFSYVSGSSEGVTMAEPQITDLGGGYQRLKWNLSPPRPTILPGETLTQSFRATATLEEGTYYDSAWVILKDGGENTYYTSPTAPVQVYRVFDIEAQDGDTTTRANVKLIGGSVTILSWQIQ